jgi:hypothetical protein
MGKAAVPWQARLIQQTGSDCWIFSGSLNDDGYGQIRVGGRKGKTIRVHRLAWEEVHGPIPDGMTVCHTCDVPACCNPAHLFLGTQQDNVQDMMNKRRFVGRAALNALKTHCPQGHEYTAENTRTYRGMRSCVACYKERGLARYYRLKAEAVSDRQAAIRVLEPHNPALD